MPVIAKVCAILMLMLLVRCPAIGQQVCARLAALSVDCTASPKPVGTGEGHAPAAKAAPN